MKTLLSIKGGQKEKGDRKRREIPSFILSCIQNVQTSFARWTSNESEINILN